MTSGKLSPGNPDLIARIREEMVGAGGVISFARFMEMALYSPELGYYLSPERKPGRGGDFITSPEISPLFGLTLARQLAECWERLGQPASWTIREHGAGVGGLAYDIMAGLAEAQPDAFAGLTYQLIELNPHMRIEAQRSMKEVGLLDRVIIATPEDDLAPITGVVLANEVADAIPVQRLVFRGDAFRELGVSWNDGAFVWSEMPLSEVAEMFAAYLEATGVAWKEGNVADGGLARSDWFATVVNGIERGYAIVIDYGYPVTELFDAHRLEGTIRGFSGHTVTDDPFLRVGRQDLTVHVDFTALQMAGERAGLELAGFTNQGSFLSSLDLGDFLVRLQSDPETSVEAYLASQAVVLRLIDPGGLGRFGVLVMARDAAIEPHLQGFAIPRITT